MAKVVKNNRAESLNCLYHHGLNLALIMKEAKRWPTDGWMLAGQCIVSFFLTFFFLYISFQYDVPAVWLQFASPRDSDSDSQTDSISQFHGIFPAFEVVFA
ncbi:GD14435 [Drosophila simulans]|uniref:GD14435 n=1 Tax=Drosophila simulans TaxID=7240 RepID=B4QJ03_DROSI|nr:GD14435 [Drosophila simulans]